MRVHPKPESIASLPQAPTTAVSDASWGERFFHIIDPAGHELAFAAPVRGSPFWEAAPGRSLDSGRGGSR